MIRLRDIHKEYQNGTKALKGVSMQIDDGDFVFLVGPSGSGKSTIIKLITAEISPTRGKLMVNGYNLNDISEKQIPLMRRTIGVVFQDFRLIEKKENNRDAQAHANTVEQRGGNCHGGAHAQQLYQHRVLSQKSVFELLFNIHTSFLLSPAFPQPPPAPY